MTDVTLKALAAERQVSVDRRYSSLLMQVSGNLLTTLCPHKKNRLYWRT